MSQAMDEGTPLGESGIHTAPLNNERLGPTGANKWREYLGF